MLLEISRGARHHGGAGCEKGGGAPGILNSIFAPHPRGKKVSPDRERIGLFIGQSGRFFLSYGEIETHLFSWQHTKSETQGLPPRSGVRAHAQTVSSCISEKHRCMPLSNQSRLLVNRKPGGAAATPAHRPRRGERACPRKRNLPPTLTISRPAARGAAHRLPPIRPFR